MKIKDISETQDIFKKKKKTQDVFRNSKTFSKSKKPHMTFSKTQDISETQDIFKTVSRHILFTRFSDKFLDIFVYTVSENFQTLNETISRLASCEICIRRT